MHCTLSRSRSQTEQLVLVSERMPIAVYIGFTEHMQRANSASRGGRTHPAGRLGMGRGVRGVEGLCGPSGKRIAFRVCETVQSRGRHRSAARHGWQGCRSFGARTPPRRCGPL